MKKFFLTFTALIVVFSLIISGASALTPSYEVSESYKSGVYYKQLSSVTLTGNYIDDIVNVARSQIGYHESDNKNDLIGTSQGNSDYTEYCNWFGHDVGWCAVFISWCARQAKVPETIISNNSLADGKGGNFGEKSVYSFSKHTAQKGDIVYINNDSDPDADHVGIVYDVDDTFIYTVEGNTSQQVYDVKYYKDSGIQYYYSDTNIVYYGVPNYGVSSKLNQKNTYVKGDVDGNGSVNSVDALLSLRISTGLMSASEEQKQRADFNSDGSVNSFDALQILEFATKN